jgi:creatinine amidohydrolase/Fe(II)-dependent formamide hydrolase-like protein
MVLVAYELLKRNQYLLHAQLKMVALLLIFTGSDKQSSNWCCHFLYALINKKKMVVTICEAKRYSHFRSTGNYCTIFQQVPGSLDKKKAEEDATFLLNKRWPLRPHPAKGFY